MQVVRCRIPLMEPTSSLSLLPIGVRGVKGSAR